MNIRSIESRVAALEAIIEQIGHRLNSIDSRLNNMDNRFTNIEIESIATSGGLLITILIANIGTAITVILTVNKS